MMPLQEVNSPYGPAKKSPYEGFSAPKSPYEPSSSVKNLHMGGGSPLKNLHTGPPWGWVSPEILHITPPEEGGHDIHSFWLRKKILSL